MTRIRTVEISPGGPLAQGKAIAPKVKPFCSCADGYIPIDRCDCLRGWARRATVRTGPKTTATGRLIERKRDE